MSILHSRCVVVVCGRCHRQGLFQGENQTRNESIQDQRIGQEIGHGQLANVSNPAERYLDDHHDDQKPFGRNVQSRQLMQGRAKILWNKDEICLLRTKRKAKSEIRSKTARIKIVG